MMNEFLIGLQFLTRINLVRQESWSEENFGKSVKFFPAVGAVLGIFFAAATAGEIFLSGGRMTIFIGATFFVLNVILTGGLHCDGLMDTADGIFSGREKEKILEIMKDSRAGAFGVVSLVVVAALQISEIAELVLISAMQTLAAVYSAPIIGRFLMVAMIKKFPYARPQGIGKAFAKFSSEKTLPLAFFETLILFLPLAFFDKKFFLTAFVALIITSIFTMYFGKVVTKKIGGVTGDIYGATEILSETFVLIIFLLTNFLPTLF